MEYVAGGFTGAQIVANLTNMLVGHPNFEMHDDQTLHGYTLKYIPDDSYLTICLDNGTLSSSTNSSGQLLRHAIGIGVWYSSDWDIATHTPSGSQMRALIPLWSTNAYSSYPSGNIPIVLGEEYLFDLSMWVDQHGFELVVNNNNTRSGFFGRGAFASGVFAPVDKREFNDAFSSFFFHCKPHVDVNSPRADNDTGIGVDHARFLDLRPFEMAASVNLVNNSDHVQAYRSLGNSKVYFDMPVFHNERQHHRTPILVSKRWFPVSDLSGLAVNDILQWIDPDETPPVTRKYIVKRVHSSLAGFYHVAMPYENAPAPGF